MVIYKINGTEIRSPKKIYKVNGVLCHKKGDFYEEISPRLLFKIEMSKLNEKSNVKNATVEKVK